METSTQASTSRTQRSSSPSPGRKEFMQREEEIEKILQNSSHRKQKWCPTKDHLTTFDMIYIRWPVQSVKYPTSKKSPNPDGDY
ncbi:hypothetical protein Tco_0387322 [Tanacetum coccineum]